MRRIRRVKLSNKVNHEVTLMSNLNQLLLYTESVHEKQRKRKFKDWILLCTILFVSMITFYSCSDSGGTSPDLDSELDPEEPVMEDPPPAPKLSDIVDSIRAEYNFPAMGAAIVTLEKGFTIGVSGERRLGSGVAVQNGDHWSWGSNTKAITAFITARAVDDGLLLWDQTLEELFPEFTDEMRDEYRSVT